MPGRRPLPARRAAFQAATRAMKERRGRGAPVRDAFFRWEEDGRPHHPLAQLMNSRSGRSGGGRGGRTRLALYLSLLWVASGGDHSTQRPASFWASLLGLSDPEDAGSRVIRSTWAELEVRGLVKVTPGTYSGDVPTVRPLREDGSRRAYTIPLGRDGDTYRRLPEAAWRELIHAEELTGAGLVMYLVALRTAEQAGRTDGLTFPRAFFRDEYGMGESTRKSGLRNLVDLAVLVQHLEHVDVFGDVLERRRPRAVYDLLPEYARPTEPAVPAPGTREP